MADLIAISDPTTGRTYRVHPHIARQGVWFSHSSQSELRELLPDVQAFERDLARLAQQNQFPEKVVAHA